MNDNLGRKKIEKLIAIFKIYPEAIWYTFDDLKGISPFVCMHKILLEEDSKPSREHYRRLNPNIIEVVKKLLLKLLDTRIIYPISDSK